MDRESKAGIRTSKFILGRIILGMPGGAGAKQTFAKEPSGRAVKERSACRNYTGRGYTV